VGAEIYELRISDLPENNQAVQVRLDQLDY
jgi:hypothetical protein